MILLALSFAAWLTCAFTGFMSLASLLLVNAKEADRELPRGVYLGLALVAGRVSFYLFHNLGGPRQW
ncbi:hypothetical protein ASE36_00395 [Rhizobium sp. Root274]|uniref:hypothetical protein n=1 Tax=unclassified Rhizobium TaxID=2613769 RepID=UPI000712498C|nr:MULTISPECIES: hypothetical protein [unclassified Rhizobium]KQW30798.1 hypothetical protein ASC71_00395 [Rhizobium sp. Root1240]KRD32345.1 hypothetical protein ASE36_00395 [Rhizobium sp. Root274]